MCIRDRSNAPEGGTCDHVRPRLCSCGLRLVCGCCIAAVLDMLEPIAGLWLMLGSGGARRITSEGQHRMQRFQR
eukprot:11117824-Alexandrium_andersonii.AAC.1